MEIRYFPGFEVEHETEKAILVKFKYFHPHTIKRMEKRGRSPSLIEKKKEETEEVWIPKSAVVKREGEIVLLKWAKDNWGFPVSVVLEGNITPLLKKGYDAIWELKFKFAIENFDLILHDEEIKISEEDWRKRAKL